MCLSVSGLNFIWDDIKTKLFGHVRCFAVDKPVLAQRGIGQKILCEGLRLTFFVFSLLFLSFRSFSFSFHLMSCLVLYVDLTTDNSKFRKRGRLPASHRQLNVIRLLTAERGLRVWIFIFYFWSFLLFAFGARCC